jgi:hypothetical protein
MDKRQTTFGLSPEKIAELLNIGSGIAQSEKEANQNQIKAELLRDRLAETLPLNPSMLKFMPKVLVHMCHKLEVLAGKPIGKLILDPQTDISLVKNIKDYSKNLSESAKTEAENDTSVAIYYAAIANALVYHNLHITKFSFQSLRRSFYSLVSKPWMSADFVNLFKKAKQICQSESEVQDYIIKSSKKQKK